MSIIRYIYIYYVSTYRYEISKRINDGIFLLLENEVTRYDSLVYVFIFIYIFTCRFVLAGQVRF